MRYLLVTHRHGYKQTAPCETLEQAVDHINTRQPDSWDLYEQASPAVYSALNAKLQA